VLAVWELVQLAKYLGIAPWELAAHPDWWEAGEMCMTAENALNRERARRAGRSW
jgi:hypothetical protein